MNCCTNCKQLTGRAVIHEEDQSCPLAKSLMCRRCHARGHMTSQCPEQWDHWERPTTLEELIPADIRLRYGIQSHTRLEFMQPRGSPGTENELSSVCTITVPDDYNLLNKFIETRRIKIEGKVTKPSYQDCVKAVITWAQKHGYRAVFVNEVSLVKE